MLPTRVAAFAARAIEATWLVALITVPLLFNVSSNSSFELDKVALVRAFAWILVGFWTVHRLERWLTRSREPSADGTRGWALLGASFLGVHALASAMSVAPRVSVTGSSTRWQGLVTVTAYIVLYWMVLAFLRRPKQLERWIDAALVVSLPVSLYGIIQHFGTDPVRWATDTGERVASSLGNPIFVSAFLILVVPLTIYRHVDAARHIASGERQALTTLLLGGGLASLILQIAAWRLGPVSGTLGALVTLALWSLEARVLEKPRLPFVRLAACNVLLSVQLACLLLAQSRGPWIGLVTGLLFLALVWAIVRNAWFWARTVTLGGAAVVIALVALNVPGPLLDAAEEIPYVQRLTRMAGSTGRVRLIIWEASSELVRSDPLRALVGYGPETQRLVLAPHVPAELGQVELRGALPDRAHNESFDLLITAGVLGASIHVLWLLALLTAGLGCVGLVRRGRDRHVFVGACIGGAVGLLVLVRLVDGSWRLGGPALVLGIITGTFAYLAVHAVRGGTLSSKTAWSEPGPVVAVLLAAIVAHTVELQFGIAVTASRVYFFVYAASLAVAVRRFAWSPAANEPPADRGWTDGPESFGYQDLAAGSLLVGLTLVTLLYDFVPATDAPAELMSVPWLFGFTWFLGGILAVSGAAGRAGGLRRASRLFAIFTAMALGAVASFAAWRLVWHLSDVAEAATALFVFVLAVVLVLGRVTLTRTEGSPLLVARTWALPLYLVLLGAGAAIALGPSLEIVRADVDYKRARLASIAGRPDQALHFARRALMRQSSRDTYHGELGRLLMNQALHESTPEDRESSFSLAEKSFRTASALSPLDPDYPANLSRLYAAWAGSTDDAETKRVRLEAALRFSGDALARHPANVRLRNERAAILFLMGETERALEAYQTSLELDDRFAETYLHIGDIWHARGDLDAAAAAYEEASTRSPESMSIAALQRLSVAYAALGRVDDAIEVNERILQRDPRDAAAHGNLASLLSAAGDWNRALAHADRAIATAAPRDKSAFEELKSRLRERSIAARE